MENETFQIVIAALVGLIALLGFVLSLIGMKRGNEPTKQALECAFQHEKIDAKLSRTEVYIEKIAAHLAELTQLTRDQSQALNHHHAELIREIRKN